MGTPSVTLAQALLYHQNGQLVEAADVYRQILQADPNRADVWHLFGVLVHQIGRHNEASEFIRQAIAIDGSKAIYHDDLGRVFQALDDWEGAAASHRQALQLAPDAAGAHFNLATSLLNQGRLAEGTAHFRQSLALRPNFAQAHNNLGVALMKQGQLSEAVAAFRQALQLKPDHANAHNNLGNALRELGQLDLAARSFEEALRLTPDFAEAHNNLGTVLMDRGQLSAALSHYRRALELQPDFAAAHSNLLFCLNLDPQADPGLVFSEHCRWASIHGEPGRVSARSSPGADATRLASDPQRRLRIGYVSGDFRRHPVAAFFEPILAHHDPAQIEAICYAELRLPDDHTRRLQALARGWRWTCDLSDERLAALIQADGIDILVDLAGHTANHRLRTFARKPAPVQVTYLGYPNTTGLKSIDYRLTDAVLDPPEAGPGRYTEELVRLPGGFCCWAPPAQAPEVAAPPVTRLGQITFGSLHRPEKLNAAVFDLWARLLHAVPGARLLLYRHTLTLQTRDLICRQLLERGVSGERLELRQRTDLAGARDLAPAKMADDHLAIYRDIDIALDVFPWSGHATSCEALWMGVPVVSLAQVGCASRLTASVLTRLGLTDLIALDPEQYLSLAAALAADRHRLRRLRTSLRDLMAARLCAGQTFTRALETAYRDMWRRWTARARLAATGGSAERALAPVTSARARLAATGESAETAADASQRLGLAAFERGDHDRAIAYLEEAAARNPTDATVHSNLAEVYRLAGMLAQAAQSARQALQLQPDLAAAHNNLGIVLHDQGRLEEALASYQRAIALKPDDAEAHNNLGNALQRLARLAEAELSYQEALHFQPDFVLAHTNLGNVRAEQGRLDEAAACYRQALRFEPDFGLARIGLASVLREQGRLDEAEACSREALRLQPNCAAAHNCLGNALKDQGKRDLALACYQQAVCLQPDLAEVQNNLAVALMEQRRLPEALGCFREALRLNPDYDGLLFCLNHDPNADLDHVFAEHCRWASLQALSGGHEPAENQRVHPGSSDDPERRLRIGYVSPDLRRHPVASFFEPILANHDPARVEAICYAEVRQPDEVTARLQALAAGWRWTCGQSATDLAALIRSDGIDILVDLAGHTGHNRLKVFAHQPAPVQVTYLGYPNTTGLRSIHYRLTDAVLDPDEKPARYTEKLVRLAGGFCCFAPPGAAPELTPLPAPQVGQVTFGSLHRPEKITALTLDLWCQVLHAVPTARLIMYRPTLTGKTAEQLQREFSDRGIGGARLEMRSRAPAGHYLDFYQEVDIALDVFPWSGHATTCDALWMGVPVPTLIGQSAASRLTASVLTRLALSELIAATPETFVALTVQLAGDCHRLAELRATLRERMRACLCDGKRFTAELESAYRTMWQKWCAESLP